MNIEDGFDIVYVYQIMSFNNLHKATILHFLSTLTDLFYSIGGPEDCSNTDNFLCWLSCLDIPADSDKSVDQHLVGGESLYCLDPSVLATTKDVAKAVEACTNPQTGEAGAIHNPACGNYWYETTADVQTYTIKQEYESDLLKERYCYGKTSMYMDGFAWEDTTCILYLFPSWVISTRAALIGACFGTILFGMLVEFTIRQRRTILGKLKKGKTKMAWSALLYGLQLTASYLIMLIIMTYSGPLFMSAIIGLVSGHVVFSWQDVVGENGSGEVPALEGSTPCCQNIVEEEDGFNMNQESYYSTDSISDKKTTADTSEC